MLMPSTGSLLSLRNIQLATLLTACLSLPVAVADNTSPPANTSAKLVAEVLNSKKNTLLQRTDFSKFTGELRTLYSSAQNNLLWLNSNRSQEALYAALALLTHADNQGLNPADYDAEILNQLLNTQSLDATKSVDYDTAISAALLHYLHDLHEGRIRPQDLSYPNNFGNKATQNAATAITQSLAQNLVAELPQQFEPKIKQYQRLKQGLSDLRAQAPESAFQPLQIDKSLHPGEAYSQLNMLNQRLVALGALAANTATTDMYDGVLVDGIKSLQQKQGLQADGVIGKDTLALLNQTRTEKIRQIELAMERLRWLPGDLDGPLIIVNIPAFQLWAFNSSDDTQALNMKVIVGKAQANQTPMLFESMQYLEFMPYWNIPKSILDKEIMPKLQDDIAYLQDQDIELVQRIADDSDGNEDIVDELRHGKLRARQRPGKKNPLGKVKFIFPNKEDVYLHDTPSHGLFERSRRDFSHGCVRVSDAEKLAEFVLSRQNGWDRTAIQQAMTGDKTQRVKLKQSIPVLFFYSTSFVDQDNQLHFYRDIYGHDADLQKALSSKQSNSAKESNSVVTGKDITAG
jgi:murein L,D-transpeptidase YcbB/YkuD